ncbi:MAG TPA: O-antigen ligase family protein [Patescibacteria group bacterium]|nr:O-antigen ligase family protein [Patescibacteria group bacterium]
MTVVARAALPVARRGFLLAGAAAALVPIAVWIGRAPLTLPLVVACGGILFAAVVLRAEAGLIIVIGSMLLSPEIALGSAGHGGLEASRSVVLRTEDLILMLVGFAWLARMAIHKDLGAVRRTSLNGAIGAYVACCLLSTLLGIEAGRLHPAVALCYVLKYVEYFFIFFITVNYVRTPRQMERLLAALLVTAALITLYAWWQIPSGARPSAPFEGATGEPNTLGGYLVLIFSIACALALEAPNSRVRTACGLLCAAIVPALLATLSRSSWLAFLASLGALVLLLPRRTRLLGAATAGAVLLCLFMPGRIEDRLAYTFTSTASASESLQVGRLHLDTSSSARIASWSAALQGWKQHPVLGWGVTGFGFLDAQYFRVLVEIGLVGFLAFSVLVLACLRAFRRARATLRAPVARALAAGMLAGLAGILVHSIGTNTFLLIRIMEPFWMLTGLVIAATGIEAEAS